MPRFPFPLKSKTFTVYGREQCPYCKKLKKFLTLFYAENFEREVRYYDLDKLIADKKITDFLQFQQKMQPFIHDYKKIPIVFFQGEFIGGYDKFCEIMNFIFHKSSSNNKIKKRFLDILKNNNINKQINICEKLLQNYHP